MDSQEQSVSSLDNGNTALKNSNEQKIANVDGVSNRTGSRRSKGSDASHLLSFQFRRSPLSSTQSSTSAASLASSQSRVNRARPRASSLSQGNFLQAKYE